MNGTNQQILAPEERADQVEMLRRMLLIRDFDSRLPQLYSKNLIRGSAHSAAGQEAVAVGACQGLDPQDMITSTHRGHGHSLAKGADPARMMAELLGRQDGYCKGKGGSMHIADFSLGMLGANGIVGGGFGIATGAALSSALTGSGQVVVCFFGDGALNQGGFLEAGNMAAIWRLPVIFLCENNGHAMSARPEEMVSVKELPARALAFGISGTSVDGMDVLAVRDAVRDAAKQARAGEGPTFLEARCYRFDGHFPGDTNSYRTEEEVREWRLRDPIDLHARRLVDAESLTEADVADLRAQAKETIDEAIRFARNSPQPAVEAAWEDIYA
jgi:pyruvate dehydrogenase E1 component alpha subunit